MRHSKFYTTVLFSICMCSLAWAGTVVENFDDGALDCPWAVSTMWNPTTATNTDFTVANGVGTFAQTGDSTTASVGTFAESNVGSYIYGDFTMEWTFPDIQQFQDGMAASLFQGLFWVEGGGVSSSIIYIFRGGNTLWYCAMGADPALQLDITSATKVQFRLVKTDDGTDSWLHFWYNVDDTGWSEYVGDLYPHQWPGGSGKGVFPYMRFYHNIDLSIDIDDLTLTNDALPDDYSCSWGEIPGATIPDVSGMSQADAVAALEAAGYVVSVQQEASDTVAAGNIVRTDPVSGTELAAGETVTVVVSTGSGATELPVGGLALMALISTALGSICVYRRKK